MDNDPYKHVITALENVDFLSQCGSNDIRNARIMFIDTNIQEIVNTVLAMNLDATAKKPMDIILVNAHRLIAQQRLHEMNMFPKLNAILYDSLGIGIKPCHHTLKENIFTTIYSGKWGIKLTNRDQRIISEFFADVAYCYAFIGNTKHIDKFHQIFLAYELITKGHLPYDIIGVNGKKNCLHGKQ